MEDAPLVNSAVAASSSEAPKQAGSRDFPPISAAAGPLAIAAAVPLPAASAVPLSSGRSAAADGRRLELLAGRPATTGGGNDVYSMARGITRHGESRRSSPPARPFLPPLPFRPWPCLHLPFSPVFPFSFFWGGLFPPECLR